MSTQVKKSICAFDIGIKNLSYCIIEIIGDDIKQVTKWELINLQTARPTCIGTLKGGKICGKDAKMCHKTDKTIFYCSKHTKQYKPSLNEPTTCSARTCEFLTGEKHCKKSGNVKLDGKVYCTTHIKKIQTQQSSKEKLCSMKIVGCMKEPLYDLGTHMYEAIDKKPEILEVDRIVIENQPSLTNPTMKSISMLLLSYFIMKKHPNVEFISPSGKLKVNEQLTKAILAKCPTKPIKYETTKSLGVIYTKKLLEEFKNDSKWAQMLDDTKKEDDLCDAFLHAYYHLYNGHVNNKLLTSKEFIESTTKFFEDRIKEKMERKKKSLAKTKENKGKSIKLDV